MTEQRKSLIKLIAAVVIILLLPVLFFRFIGDDPENKNQRHPPNRSRE